ncbi:MAG TPA: hypothetical protein VKS21_02150, partial [Spirochaetota bacterium]|nr:hypothetical protein [Spirochaetota bacterium]
MKTFKKIFTVFTLIITLFSQDNNYFNFEEDKMGWAPHYDPADHMQITNVIWNNNPSYTFLGNGSIEVQFDDMVAVENKPNDRGHAEVALSNFAPYNFPPGQPYYNLSNETLQIRFLVPAAHWDPNIEVYLVLKSTNDNWTWYRDYGPFNAGTGVTADVWYETNITLGVTPYNFSDATFNMSRVYRMGIKISAQSAGGVDAGSVYLDSWHWGGDNAPPFISN